MPYIGNQPAEQFTSFATQEFSTSATTSYTLDHAVTNENEIALFVNNVRQQPGSGKAYTASGTTLTLSAATASTDTMYCVFLGRALQTVNPATNSISTAMISDNAVTAAKISASLGKVLQVVSTTKTDTFAGSTEDTWYTITGLTAAITPSSTSSKILVTGHVMGSEENTSSDRRFYLKIQRGGSDISSALGDSASSRLQVHTSGFSSGGANALTLPFNFLDSPSSTSALTYSIQVRGDTNGVVVNQAATDSDNDTYPRAVSTITVMEIGA